MSVIDISMIVFVSGGSFKLLGFATLPIRSIPPATVCLSIGYIGVTLVALPRLSRGYFAEVILQVSRPGRGWTTQSLYAMKLRATIIGYIPPLVLYSKFRASPRRDIPAAFGSS